MRVFLFLWIVLLTMAQAEGSNKTLENPVPVNQQALEDLKKQIESLHLLLDQTKRTPIKNNDDDLRKRFHQALEKADKELKKIDQAMKMYDTQAKTDQTLNVPWQKFEQNIANFDAYMKELERIYVESKEQDQTGFRPVTAGQDSTRANPVNRKRRKRTAEDQSLPLPSEKEEGQGPKVRYHYTTESPKNSDEEPFLK